MAESTQIPLDLTQMPCPFCNSRFDARKLPAGGRERLILSSRLAWIRRQKKLSIRDVREGAHCSTIMIRNIEMGITMPSVPLLLRLARFYQVSLEDLLTDLTGREI